MNLPKKLVWPEDKRRSPLGAKKPLRLKTNYFLRMAEFNYRKILLDKGADNFELLFDIFGDILQLFVRQADFTEEFFGDFLLFDG